MLTLILLRHAKAEPGSFSVADIERPLADRGRSDAPRLGAWITAHDLVPDYIVCSPARRARETLALAKPAFGNAVETVYEPAIYEATAMRILTLVRRTPVHVKRLMLVGHNPGFENLAKDLTGTADEEAGQRLDKKYPTAGLAVLSWPKASSVETWQKVTGRTAHLAAFVAPRYLD